MLRHGINYLVDEDKRNGMTGWSSALALRAWIRMSLSALCYGATRLCQKGQGVNKLLHFCILCQ